MDRSNMKSRAAAVAAGLAMVATMASPLAAFAADMQTATPDNNSGSSQTTEVTIESLFSDSDGQQTSDDNLAFSTPTKIPFSAKADGTMLTASADHLQIVNKSVFPVHVTKMQVAEKGPFKLSQDVSKGTENNAFQFTAHGAQAAAEVDLSQNKSWNMGYASSDTDHINLDVTDAKIARVTADLSTAQSAATITWTVASGNVA